MESDEETIMRSRLFQAITLLAVVSGLGTLACDLSTLGIASNSKPQVTIQSPVANANFKEGDDVLVQSTSVDSGGIVRVELGVDGATVQTDVPPVAKQASFTLVQKWKAAAGTHTIGVRAFNAAGIASDPALLTILVAPGFAAQPTIPLTLQTIIPPIGVTSPTAPLVSAAPTLASILPTATRTPTRIPVTPTINAPPGIWAISIRTDPSAPKRTLPVRFYVTFLNTTGTLASISLRIRIFEPDKRNSFGDTTPVPLTLPMGMSEQPSSDNWRVTGPGDCIPFFARAFSVDPNTKAESEFLKPDSSGGPAASFQVCP
jgi:hypothetical protein